MSIENVSNMAIVVGILIGGVNVVVEVLKACWLKKESSKPWAVLIVSEIMVFLSVCANCALKNIDFDFNMVTGCFAGGFFIAYGAMFGYEKLYGEFLKKIDAIMGKVRK